MTVFPKSKMTILTMTTLTTVECVLLNRLRGKLFNHIQGLRC